MPSRMLNPFLERKNGEKDQCNPQTAHHWANGLAVRGIPAAARMKKGDQNTHQQFPSTSLNQIKRAGTGSCRGNLGEPEANQCREQGRYNQPAPTQSEKQQEKKWKYSVVLLFNTQASSVKQRFKLTFQIEIASSLCQQNIVTEENRGHEALTEIFKVIRQHPCPCKRQAKQHHKKQGWQYSPCPPFVKAGERERARFLVREYGRGDEVAANDEEDINADKAALEHCKSTMEEDYGQHSHRAQTIDLSSVSERGAHSDVVMAFRETPDTCV